MSASGSANSNCPRSYFYATMPLQSKHDCYGSETTRLWKADGKGIRVYTHSFGSKENSFTLGVCLADLFLFRNFHQPGASSVKEFFVMAKGFSEYQNRVLNFLAAIQTAYQNLSDADRAEFELWESRYASTLGSSSWPRWKEFIPAFLYVDFSEQQATKKSNKKTIPQEVRWEVWVRDNFTCTKCGSRKKLSVDHIYPESKGGTLDLENLQTLCKSCNSRKGASVEVKVEK